MDIIKAMEVRHSVRQYLDRKIPGDIIEELKKEIEICNQEAGLHIQLVTDEKDAFSGMMAHYGKFDGVQNYIALIGTKGKKLDETIGYYGERIVLKAQQLGLDTCWVAMTFSKRKCRVKINKGEKMVCVLSLGYGKTQGISHKSKDIRELCDFEGDMPDWFKRGMEAAVLAPTAMNQQKFMISLKNDTVSAKKTGGFYSNVDLGIVKYHFEIGSGRGLI
ncbi:nitroreductase family protein [Anaerocolumna xylanovorans]|uniref:Putative TM nitroreductase n=1 Tax=Anaerocolumna xylanovorans DSM 12503 TaxID=1121345 RepID=A0A1M7XVY5_9FIRM|nr:nitroreductase family protein [Anaerocolumna xylanovorans]SHO42875.1 Putative TM nitroreductase [Anaerocolumna xylanovorans DSM 12503]